MRQHYKNLIDKLKLKKMTPKEQCIIIHKGGINDKNTRFMEF